MATSFQTTRWAADPAAERNWRLAVRVGLVALLLLIGLAVVDLTSERGAGIPAEAAAFVPAVFPDRSSDGVLRVEITPGAYDAFARGEAGYLVPPVMQLQAGDAIEVVNHDSGGHMIFYAYVPPGSTARMQFDEPGVFTYSSGCAVNPKMNSFTSVVVSA
jgi:hypothetical protein